MAEEITVSKKIIAGVIALIVFFGFILLSYDYFYKELTWKQTVKEYVERVRLGHSYYDGDRTSELIFLLKENGFETYSVKAFGLKGFCVIETDGNAFTLSLDLKLKIFDECLEPVQYIKVIAVDGNYFIDAWTGEYVPKALARGEKKAIVVK